MDVLIAPDGFGGTMDAYRAGSALAAGWVRARPGDRVTVAPQSDGGPGFVDVLAAALPGSVTGETTVSGPLGDPVRARWLRAGADPAGPTVYIESAQACGLHLLGRTPDPGTAWQATSRGVGELLAAAGAIGAARVVVGLGGSAVTDGGLGMLEVLAGDPYWGPDADPGRRPELIAASDVRNRLLGPAGAAAVFGPQKGADPATVAALERRLARAPDEYRRWPGGHGAEQQPGSGAAGGLGAGLVALGGRIESGADLVGRHTGRAEAVAGADLVITGEGRIDGQTAGGKVVSRLAAEALTARRPVIAIVGASAITAAEQDRLGLAAVFSLTAHAGSTRRATVRAEQMAQGLAAAVAARTDPATLARWRSRSDRIDPVAR